MATNSVRKMTAVYGADITDFMAKIKMIETANQKMVQRTEEGGRQSQVHARNVLGALASIRAGVLSVTGAMAGLTAVGTSSAFMAMANQAVALENQMRGFGVATDEARQKVYALAMETRTPIQSTIGLLRAMRNALPGQELDQTMRQVATLNRLMTIGGLDAGARGSVILQFGQALQSGVLQGDELRALRESAPYDLIKAIAEEAGGTVDQLRKMGAEGQITTEIMVRALTRLEQVSKDKFGNFGMTVGEATEVVKTGLLAVAGEVNRSLGATEMMSSAIAAMGHAFANAAPAAGQLVEALKVVAQVALLAGGARGVGMLVAAAPAAGAAMTGLAARAAALAGSVNGLNASMVAVVGTQKALSGLIGLMGGPYAAAAFAIGAAMMFIARSNDTIRESLDKAKEAGERATSLRSEIASLSQERLQNAKSLETAETALKKAIEDQAPAAEETARREIAALQRRIDKTDELLAIQSRLAEQAEAEEQQAIEDARQGLVQEARIGLRGLPGRGQEYTQLLRSGSDDEILAAYNAELDAMATLDGRQKTFLQDQATYIERMNALRQKALTTLGAHVDDWQRHIDALMKTSSEAVAKANETQSKYDALIAQREAVVARSQLSASSSGYLDPTTATAALRNLDADIAKLLKVDDTVEEVSSSIAEMREMLARGGAQFDKDGALESSLIGVEALMQHIVTKGDEVNAQDMAELIAAFSRLLEEAKGFRGELEQIPGAIAGIDLAAAKLANMFPNGMIGAGPHMITRGQTSGMLDTIKQNEDFRSNAYYDVNHWRVGYGTDHIYKKMEDGSFRFTKVVEGMTATMEEATYTLEQRLVKEFLPPIIDRIGQSRWEGLNEAQRTSLADLSWNYGPGAWSGTLKPVLDAIVQGTMQDVANAIQATAWHNPENKGKDGLPVNYHRRMRNAAAWGDTSASQEQAAAITEAATAAERLRDAQEQYVRGLADANERTQLELEIADKTLEERERILRIHELTNQFKELGLALDDRVPGEEELTVREKILQTVEAEIEAKRRQAVFNEVERQREEEHNLRMQELEEEKQRKLSQEMDIRTDLQGIVVGTLMNTKDGLEAAGQLLLKLAEAYLYAGLFGGQGGDGGLFGGIFKNISGLLTGGLFAQGGIMTELGPVELRRYASGGIANRPQFALFGEGSQPEAYVPLPDGRTIPVTLKVPDVPTPSAYAGGLLRVALELDSALLRAEVVEASAPVAAEISRKDVQQFSRHGLPSRVRRINSDPKRIG